MHNLDSDCIVGSIHRSGSLFHYLL